MSIPNLITLARILLVPVVVWAIASNQMLFAFLLFAAAGVSDAVDGFLAKRFGMASELGAYLDPLADKVLIVSIYVSLGIVDALPRWLVILVVSRDLLIVGGVMFSWLIGRPVSVKPHPVSKLNTAAQLGSLHRIASVTLDGEISRPFRLGFGQIDRSPGRGADDDIGAEPCNCRRNAIRLLEIGLGAPDGQDVQPFGCAGAKRHGHLAALARDGDPHDQPAAAVASPSRSPA